MNVIKLVLFEGKDVTALRSLAVDFSHGILDHKLPISHLLTREKPNVLRGRDLFNVQYHHGQFSADVVRRWNTLPLGIQKLFDDEEYVMTSYQSSVRLWQQYEIVRFLQRFLSQTYDPYQLLDLKPQEIIMDKILQGKSRDKDTGNNGGDIYDDWIERALTTKANDPATCTHRFLRGIKPKFATGFHQFLREYHQDWNIDGIGGIVREGKRQWAGTSTQRQLGAFNRVYSTVTAQFWYQWIVLQYMELQGHEFTSPWRTNDFSSVYYNGHYLKYYMFVSKNRVEAVPFQVLL